MGDVDGMTGPDAAGSDDRGGIWHRWDTVAEREPMPGVHFRVVAGSAAMACRVWLEPGAIVISHAHPHEHISVVMEGELEYTVGEETRSVGPGDVTVIAGGTTHAVIAGPAGAIVFDIFSPPREDFLA